MNNVMSDLALDMGLEMMEAEYEGRIDLSEMQTSYLPDTGSTVSGGNHLSPKLSLDDNSTTPRRRTPKPGVRGQSMRWTRMERSRP